MREIVDASVARTGLDAATLAEYFEMNLHFDLDADDERGLAEFYRRAASHGLIPSPELPPFSGVPLVPRSFS
jgi:predicted solute-binding protein